MLSILNEFTISSVLDLVLVPIQSILGFFEPNFWIILSYLCQSIFGSRKIHIWSVSQEFLEDLFKVLLCSIKEVSFVATMTVQLGHNFKVTKPLLLPKKERSMQQQQHW